MQLAPENIITYEDFADETSIIDMLSVVTEVGLKERPAITLNRTTATQRHRLWSRRSW